MSAPAFSFQTSSSSDNLVYRATKDGWENVVTKNQDYDDINPGEKLVWINGMTDPYSFEAENKNRDTGELERVVISMIRLEIQIIAGPQRGSRFLVPVNKGYVQDDGNIKPHITPKTAFGKMLSAILKREVPRNWGFNPDDIVRKPFYMVTENEQRDNYVKVKFVSARLHDEAVDGPIPGVATAPSAPPKAAKSTAPVKESDTWSEEL